MRAEGGRVGDGGGGAGANMALDEMKKLVSLEKEEERWWGVLAW